MGLFRNPSRRAGRCTRVDEMFEPYKMVEGEEERERGGPYFQLSLFVYIIIYVSKGWRGHPRRSSTSVTSDTIEGPFHKGSES